MLYACLPPAFAFALAVLSFVALQQCPLTSNSTTCHHSAQQQEAQHHAAAAAQQHGREETPGRQLPPHAADNCSPPSGGPFAAARPALHKHLAALQDLAPADSVSGRTAQAGEVPPATQRPLCTGPLPTRASSAPPLPTLLAHPHIHTLRSSP